MLHLTLRHTRLTPADAAGRSRWHATLSADGHVIAETETDYVTVEELDQLLEDFVATLRSRGGKAEIMGSDQ